MATGYSSGTIGIISILSKEAFIFSKFTDFLKTTGQGINDEVKKITSKSFAEAVIAGCALVAAADGVITSEEKQKMAGFIKQNEALKLFDISKLIVMFEKYAKSFEFDYQIGKIEALSSIAKIRSKPDESKLLVRLCCIIGSADGDFDDDEKKVVREICKELSLNPSEFGL